MEVFDYLEVFVLFEYVSFYFKLLNIILLNNIIFTYQFKTGFTIEMH